MNASSYQSDLEIHVGEYLKETLGTIEMSPQELAHKLNCNTSDIKEILNGKSSMAHPIAQKLDTI